MVKFDDLSKKSSVVSWLEFLATDPEVRVRFPALPDFLSSGSLGRYSSLANSGYGFCFIYFYPRSRAYACKRLYPSLISFWIPQTVFMRTRHCISLTSLRVCICRSLIIARQTSVEFIAPFTARQRLDKLVPSVTKSRDNRSFIGRVILYTTISQWVWSLVAR
jgi:hypothetical protein